MSFLLWPNYHNQFGSGATGCPGKKSNAASRTITSATIWQIEVEKYLPKYFMLEWDCVADYPYDEIYPTQEMYQIARDNARDNLRFKRE